MSVVNRTSSWGDMELADAPVLLLDVGSTSVKGVVVAGEVLAEARAPMPAPLPTPAGRHELPPHAVADVVHGVIARLFTQAGRIPAAAAMSTQMHSALLTDASNRPISPILTWQDDRLLEAGAGGRSHLARLTEKAGEALWRTSGIALRPGFGGGNLGVWLSEHPEVPRGGLRIHTLGSYLASQMGGPYAAGLTNAASLGLVEVRTGTWSPALAALHGLEGMASPMLLPELEVTGTITVDGHELLWLGDIGDHQASVLGSDGLAADTVAISLGTAGIAARLTDEPSDDLRVDSRPYVDGRWLHAVSRQPGGALAFEIGETLAELAGTLAGGELTAADVWQRMSTVAPAADGVAGIEAGRGEEGREVSLHRLRPGSATADLQAGLVGYYGEAYQRCVELLFPDTPPRRLAFNGGFAARNRAFSAGLAAQLGLEIHEAPPGDLALTGLRALTDRRRQLA